MRTIGWAVVFLLALPAWAGDIYRSVDADGNVRYSDRPEGATAERMHIVVSEPATPPPAPPPEPNAGAATPTADTAPAEPTTVQREPTPEERAADRAKNCSIATDRLQRYETSHRLFRTLANGEREYLTDEEIDEARARATAEVAKWCD